MSKEIKMINQIHGYVSDDANGKTRVMLSYEDVLNKLGLIHYNKVPNQTAITSINGEDQYSYEPIIDYNKVNIYMAIMQIGTKDPDIVSCIPNPLLLNHYIPSELVIELAKQSGNKMFEMELLQQIIPGFEPQQNHIVHNTPVFDNNMFTGSTSQMSNAERLYLAYKDTIKYIRDIKKIAVYQNTYRDYYGNPIGGKWFIADYEYLNPMIKELAYYLIAQAHTKEERRIANSLDGSYNNSIGIVKSLSSINESLMESSDFDRYPYLLNVLNGIVDLKTGELLPADPNLYFTQQAQVIYDPYIKAPLFEQFMEQILPDPDTRMAVLRYLGYCLTGDTSAQKALFILGSGANGKSTLLNILGRLLGPDYATSVSINLFNDRVIRTKSETTPERAKIMGKRFIQVDEIKAGEVLDVGEFKLLTGSNSIPFRDLYKRSGTMINPTHKFIFSGNYLPELRNDDRSDGGFVRRLMIAEFPRKFGPDEINPYLLDILTSPESLSGILNLLVYEASQYYKENLYESFTMVNMKEEYVSGLTKFIKTILDSDYVADPNSYVLTSDLEDHINNVISLQPNNSKFKLKQGQLKRIMSNLRHEPIRLTKGDYRNKWAYQGFKLKVNDK